MGKKAPAQPNPYDTANAQMQVNQQAAQQTQQNSLDAARLTARLNRGNTITPYGTVTSRDLGEEWLQQQQDEHYRRFLAGEDAAWTRGVDGGRQFRADLVRSGAAR